MCEAHFQTGRLARTVDLESVTPVSITIGLLQARFIEDFGHFKLTARLDEAEYSRSSLVRRGCKSYSRQPS